MMVINNQEISADFIKQLMDKMGKEQEAENLIAIKERLYNINVPEINLINSERLLNCLEYNVFDCFNICGIRYNDILSDMEISSTIQSRDKQRIINFLVNVNDIAKKFKDYKIEEVQEINIDLKEMRELLC